MTLENPQQEATYANKLIAERITDKNEYIAGALATVKSAKKDIRKLTKQSNCEHDFKLNQFSPMFDSYKCKRCKFEFSVEVGN